MRWSRALAAAALVTAGVVSSAPAGAATQSQTFTADGTLTVPATVCAVTFNVHGGTVSASDLMPGAGGEGGVVGGFIDSSRERCSTWSSPCRR